MANISFPKTEEEILEFWEKEKIFQKTLDKDAPQGDFVFYEGPPTANGKPGIHHILARAFKDLIPRYKTMQGYYVKRKAGWDTHGLPVELQVEKNLGISGKPEIEKLKTDKEESIKYFNNQCQRSVWQYKEDWEKLTKRMGFWIDLKHPYITYDNDYIESLWWIIKQIEKKDLLYKGHKVVPHCPRCGTALSSHEVAQGYKEVKENSVYIKFKIKEGNDKVKVGDYILSWTTTPWTLPGNVALAMGEDFTYVIIKFNNERLIIAESRLEVIEGDFEILDKIKGSKLQGLKYEPLFPGAIDEKTENYENAFKIYPADFVTTEDGTGIVHTAVMYGEDDYNLGIKVGLPKVHTVNEDGNFKFNNKEKILADLQGKFVKDKETEEIIINYLQDNSFLLKVQNYKHDYPFCWRCDTPLLYYAKDSWFIKMSALREQLKANNKDINWVPAHIKNGRFGEWLDGVKDWALSRERFWGTPLPVWECKSCDNRKVIGSREELKQIYPNLSDDFDLHKPFIDEIKFKCDCGGQMVRDSSVLDCWFDSGSMPFAQVHYPFANKDLIDNNKIYPADFISEAMDQTRGWFYTLLAVATLLGFKAPYKNVICLGLINDKHGKKMSKSKGNIVDPWEIMNSYGVDALRFYFYTVNQPGETKNFDAKSVEDVLKKNWLILWNVFSFYKMYVDIKEESFDNQDLHIMDKWIIAKQNNLIEEVTAKLDNYDITNAARKISEFTNELSTWYIRRSRNRFKQGGAQGYQSLQVLGMALLNLTKLLAPFAPFIAEKIYQELIKDCPVKKEFKQSVHLEEWPQVKQKNNDKILIEMKKVRQIIEKALFLRAENKIKVRQPLASLTIMEKEMPEELQEIIKAEVNVKKIILAGNDIVLDLNLTDELILEGALREIVRTVNSLRKQAKLTTADKINLFINGEGKIFTSVFEKYKEEIKKNVVAEKIIKGNGETKNNKDILINGEKISISF